MPFQLFGTQHFITLALCLLVIAGVPLMTRKKTDSTKVLIAKIIGVVIFVNLIDQIFNAFTFNLGWQEALPLHMCDLAGLAMGVYFIFDKKIFFNIGFFWGTGGPLMAILTPDLQHAFPHGLYVPFFYGHSLTLLGIAYCLIVFKVRPYLGDLIRIVFITSAAAIIIYFINVLIDSNFWFLISKPVAASIMDIFPDPPMHLLFLTPLVVFVFIVTYLPYWVVDFKKQLSKYG